MNRRRFRLPSKPIEYACDILGAASISIGCFYIWGLGVALIVSGLGLVAMGWMVERVTSRGDQS